MKNFIIKNKEIIAIGLGLVSVIFTVFAVLAVKSSKLPIKNSESTTKQTYSNIFIENETITQEMTTYYDEEVTTIPDVIKPTTPPNSNEDETNTPVIIEIDYMLKVNKSLNCITVYTKDEIGAYTVPYKSMACSISPETQTGTYTIMQQYLWYTNVSYVSRLKGTLVISSCEYKTKGDFSTLNTEKYNLLGQSVEQDGITLSIADAKWIYDNCINETPVIIYENEQVAGPLGKPELIKIPENAAYAGWDPTDSNEANGWLTCTPMILGPINLEVAIDSIKTFITKDDILERYEGLDTCGNDISNQIKINAEDLSIVATMDSVGEYVIHLELTDSLGAFSSKEVTVIIVDGETTEGDTTGEDTSEGDTSEGDTTESDTTEENTTEEDTTKEDTTESDTTEEDTTESDTTEENTSEGDTTEEDTAEFFLFLSN